MTKQFEYFFGCGPDIFPETVILTPFFLLKRFSKLFEEHKTFSGKLFSGSVASKNGKEVGLIGCSIGASLAGDAVLLLKNTSVSNILFVGSCGGVGDCNIGDIIIGENAFNGEGFTLYHDDKFDMDRILSKENMIPADLSYIEELGVFLGKRAPAEIHLKKGNIITIGSLLAETPENLCSLEGKDFKGIDMELSAAYQAAAKIGLRAAGLLFVSDLPLRKPAWEELSREDRESYNKGVQEAVDLSARFVTSN
ncbi:MAG: hypothetical protein HQ594_03375 [Candidatus Omnitrophica bacterium]|nr:hypothetical protein [Candidatus Omnitrophota bacterium]